MTKNEPTIEAPKTKTCVKVIRTGKLTPMSQETLQAIYDIGGRLISVNLTSVDWMYIFEHEVIVN